MCSPTNPSSSKTSSCSGHCADCALASSELLERTAQPRVALTALRVFILPVLFGLMGAGMVSGQTALQLPLLATGFMGSTLLLRRITGGRLL